MQAVPSRGTRGHGAGRRAGLLVSLATAASLLPLVGAAAPVPEAGPPAATGASNGPATPAADRLSVRVAHLDLHARLPEDLLRPEGRSRWDLRGVRLLERWVRTTEPG